jgi:hypothetical protein
MREKAAPGKGVEIGKLFLSFLPSLDVSDSFLVYVWLFGTGFPYLEWVSSWLLCRYFVDAFTFTSTHALIEGI